MSVTEVHGALGLDKLKNRTFQIFKVVLLDIFWTDFEKSINLIMQGFPTIKDYFPGKRDKRRRLRRKHGVAEQHFAKQEVKL